MHIILKILSLSALLTPYYISTADEPNAFPFKLGEHPFNETIEFLHHRMLRNKSLSVDNNLNLMIKNEKLLARAQQLYLEVQQDPVVNKKFVQAAKASQTGEALYEWQDACHAVNKRLHQKTKELQQIEEQKIEAEFIKLKQLSTEITEAEFKKLQETDKKIIKAELRDIYLLAHFAFQQSKHIIEETNCEKTKHKRPHKWFANTKKIS